MKQEPDRCTLPDEDDPRYWADIILEQIDDLDEMIKVIGTITQQIKLTTLQCIETKEDHT
jgi:hypothetical protein